MEVYPHLGAFESTKIHGTKEDILSTTRHIQCWQADLALLRNSGIQQLRYSVPWHRIEREPGHFDWEWMDGPMRYLEEHGMDPIVDPMHHTSFPDWLTGGFGHPEFPRLYTEFLVAFAQRYEWVTQYTVFNEALPTTLFCSYTGMWYPHQRSDQEFVAMAINVGKAICLGSEALRRHNPGIQFVHVDTCEHHRALDHRSESWVSFANHRRFLMHDLTSGRIGIDHPLLDYLERHGFNEDDRLWFADHAVQFDVLGLDYYGHSEMEWMWNQRRKRADIQYPCHNPRGFASVAGDYVDRFRTPVLLSETNIRGTVTDRLTWLKFMEEQCEQLAATGADLRGFCWYPTIDSTDWSNCCTRCTYSVDPQGIWWLDNSRWERHASELSEVYALLASGRVRSSADLPAYHLTSPLDHDLKGYSKLMNHWTRWQEPAETERVA